MGVLKFEELMTVFARVARALDRGVTINNQEAKDLDVLVSKIQIFVSARMMARKIHDEPHVEWVAVVRHLSTLLEESK